MQMTIGERLSSFGFTHAWSIDFEFVAHPGHKPEIVCMVASCIITAKTIKLWGEELSICPFDCGDGELFIAYYACAEAACFDVLGWPAPRRVLDLFPEFRRITNDRGPGFKNGLINALAFFEIKSISADLKETMRDLVMTGGPWTAEERILILDYCQSDVDAVISLVEPILAHIGDNIIQFGQALLRGRYMAALGVVENNGVPIDTDVLNRLIRHWDNIRSQLIARVDKTYGVYDGGRFIEANFANYLTKNNIPWPRLESGRLALDDDTFRDQAKSYPAVQQLQQLRSTLGQLRLANLSVGPDGRGRTMLSGFSAKTGRNQPSTSKFIFGPAVWVRHLIKPGPGRAIAYIDFSSQEIAIAAALSGDLGLWEGYECGDPYMAFARKAGLVPADATKASHSAIREQCKQVVLGVNYGMMPESIALKAGIHVDRARELLRLHQATYRQFWRWAEANVDKALLGIPLETVFGWRIHYPRGCGVVVKERSMLNWPMQSHGAEMLRLALSAGIEAGLTICAPIHDALLLEAPIDEIEEQAAYLVEIMGHASELVMGEGKRCRSDVKIIRYPDRFEDASRGTEMFNLVMSLLEEAETGADT